MKEVFPARMLRVHFGEDDRWHGGRCMKPSWPNARNWASRRRLSSAALRATDRPAGCAMQALAAQQRCTHPVELIDTEEQIGKLIPYLDTMVEEGLVATSTVEVIRYSCATVQTAEKP